MVGLDHTPSQSSEERSPAVQAQHARLGLKLFGIYFVDLRAEQLRRAPHHMPVRRLDDVRAARELNLVHQ